VHEEPRGHEISTERQQTFVSYADSAAAIVQVVDADVSKDSGDWRWDMKSFSVVLTAKASIAWEVPLVLGKDSLSIFCQVFMGGCIRARVGGWLLAHWPKESTSGVQLKDSVCPRVRVVMAGSPSI
jgi:hypothetical protein